MFEGKLSKGIKSSEFWLGLLGIIIIAGADAFGIPLTEDTVNNVFNVVMTYIGGRSAVKTAEAIKKDA